jgi:hypothetical protein
MTLETFQEIAKRTLAEKDKEKKYEWSRWWPEQTLSNAVFSYYQVTLLKSDDSTIIETLAISSDRSEEDAETEVAKWLDEQLKYRSQKC